MNLDFMDKAKWNHLLYAGTTELSMCYDMTAQEEYK